MRYFLRLAHTGRNPAASSGERRANKLRNAVLSSLHGLDDQAVRGFAEFCTLMLQDPTAAQDLADNPDRR
ncbi:MAG: hypothetical protein IT428_33630 [Planctomycetaceae bacterium]|nr:hypothetical protein [Planctomycetaceae bacterium]